MSSFSGLSIASKALATAQLALDVAGQNIANANTEGYSRKRLEVSSDYRSDTSFGQIGNGVSTMKIMQLRDAFVDGQIMDQATKKGFFDSMNGGLERIENIFNEPSDNSLGNTMDKFWNAWQDLANNPGDLSARESVRTNATVMNDQFHALAKQMIEFKKSQNDNIAGYVEQINNYTAEIKQINDEVANAELGDGKAANDSRDRRTLILKKLGEIIPISVNEDSLGRVSVTTNGNVIVGPRETVPIVLSREDVKQEDGSVISQVSTFFDKNHVPFIVVDGQLGAAYRLRDETSNTFQNQLNTMAYTIAKNVNSVHLTGYDLNQKTGILFFNPSDVQKTDPKDPSKTIIGPGINAANIALSPDIELSSTNIAAAAGGAIQSVKNQTLALASIPASGIINLKTDLGTSHPEYFNLVPNSTQIKYNGIVLQEGAGKDYIVDPIRGELRILNPGVYNDPTKFAIDSFQYNDTTFSGKGNGRNAIKIAELKSALLTIPDASGKNTQSINQYYATFIGKLGIDRNEAKSNAETRDFMLQQLNARQDAIAGVSVDEEMADMIKYEHTYQASARYISTINGLFDQLMSLAN